MGIYFTICSFVFICIFLTFFFSKNNVGVIESKIYRVLLISTFVGLFLDAFSAIIYKLGIDINGFFYMFIVKLVLIYFLVWILFFSFYIYYTSINKNYLEKEEINKLYSKYLKNVLTILGITSVITLILPVEFMVNGDTIYPVGHAVSFTYLVVAIAVIVDLFMTIKHRKEIITKKYTPLYILIISFILTAVIQKLFPDLFLVNFFLSVIVTIMYFSIENPDLKIIKELTYSKKMLERANNATIKSLNSLSEDISDPLNKLLVFGNKKISKSNIDEIITEAQSIQKLSIDLVNQINGIIELSKIESSKHELHNFNYDCPEMFDDIKQLIKIKNYGCDFRIAEDIPKVLNGDSEKIKQSIIMLFTLVTTTFDKVNMSLDVSKMEVGSLCRLRFSLIVDGPKLDKTIKEKNINQNYYLDIEALEFKILEKLIELQKGKFISKKVDNNVVEYIITIDQKIVKEYEVEEVKMKNKNVIPFDISSKRILIVDDNRDKIKEIIGLLEPYNCETDVAHDYDEFNDMLYGDKTWDLILLDDMMPDSEKFEFLNLDIMKKGYFLEKIERIAGYKISLVLMITPSKKQLEKKYEELGLDYILKPIDKVKLHSVLKNNLKDK